MRDRAYEQLMEHVAATSFALDDIILYLDTHPTDRVALAYYQKCKLAREEAVAEYEQIYGPLNANHVKVDDRWTWVITPWPWEMEER